MREPGPIGSELELHGNSGYDTEEKVDCKYLGPETRCLVISLITFPEGERFEDDDQRRQAHRQLGKEIVIGNRKREVQPMNHECAIHHASPLNSSLLHYQPKLHSLLRKKLKSSIRDANTRTAFLQAAQKQRGAATTALSAEQKERGPLLPSRSEPHECRDRRKREECSYDKNETRIQHP